MTNVTNRKINSKDYKLVHNELVKLITKLNKRNSAFLIDELLTETEKIMIVKRYGAIFMFSQNFTPYRVSNTLGITEPTASRIFSQYTKGKFNNLLTCVKKKEGSLFLSIINDLIAAQASPRARTRLLNRALR